MQQAGSDGIVFGNHVFCCCCCLCQSQRNSLSSCASAVALDWTDPLSDQIQAPYDVILASDVVYSKDVVPALLNMLKLLSGPSTVMYICSEYRKGAGLEHFHEQMMDQYKMYAQLVRSCSGMVWLTGVLMVRQVLPKSFLAAVCLYTQVSRVWKACATSNSPAAMSQGGQVQ